MTKRTKMLAAGVDKWMAEAADVTLPRYARDRAYRNAFYTIDENRAVEGFPWRIRQIRTPEGFVYQPEREPPLAGAGESR